MAIVGIDIGGSSIKSAIVDEKGDFIARFSLNIDSHKKGEEILHELSLLIRKTLQEKQIPNSEIKGLGVGCPGFINSKQGTCDRSFNLGWENLPIAAILQKETGLPAKLTNDGNAAILGEVTFGVARSLHNVVFLTLGTGVGGGLYLNDHLYEGNEGKGAELGHSLLVMDGRRCSCGRRGCLEAYVSVTALVKDTIAAMEADPKSLMWNEMKGETSRVDGHTAFECAKKGDATAQKVVDRYLQYLGEGCLSLINIFRPDAIVLGGGLSGQKEALRKPLQAYVDSHDFSFAGSFCPKCSILISKLGNDAGILGAAALWTSK